MATKNISTLFRAARGWFVGQRKRHRFAQPTLRLGYVGLIGALASAVSVLNLCKDIFHLRFSTILLRLLDTYREIWHEGILGTIWSLFSVAPPAWVNDALGIWLLTATIALRTYNFARRATLADKPILEEAYKFADHGPVELYPHLKMYFAGEPTLIAAKPYIYFPVYVAFCYLLTPVAILRLFVLRPVLILDRFRNAPSAIAARLTTMFVDQLKAAASAVIVFFAVNGGLTALP